MASKPTRGSDDRNVEARIARMKRDVEQMGRGKMISWESETLPPEERERFWRGVLAYETSVSTTDFDRLIKAGVDLPDPRSLDDTSVSAKIWEVIRHLARLRVFVSQTDHLSDRELYAHLWNESLRVEILMTDPDPASAWHVDLLGGGSEENIFLFMRFYATEEERQDWLQDFPDYVMPPHENRPFDRDRFLPRPFSEPDEHDPKPG